jgi:hypothetical protein
MEDDASNRVSFIPNESRIDLIQPPTKLNIWFILKDIKFTILTKRSCRLRLIAIFGKE